MQFDIYSAQCPIYKLMELFLEHKNEPTNLYLNIINILIGSLNQIKTYGNLLKEVLEY